MPTDGRGAGWGHRLAISFDVDLGELVQGHRVVARGIERREQGALLHYEFVPGVDADAQQSQRGPFYWYWTLLAGDDRGTRYHDSKGGVFNPSAGSASHGVRQLGGVIPTKACRLTIDFEPVMDWSPASYVRRLVIDLSAGSVVEVVRSG
jgi:hypothetical protein